MHGEYALGLEAQGTVLIAAVKDVSWSDMARTLPDSVCIATRAKRIYWWDDRNT
jgi:hypothetical protein